MVLLFWFFLVYHFCNTNGIVRSRPRYTKLKVHSRWLHLFRDTSARQASRMWRKSVFRPWNIPAIFSCLRIYWAWWDACNNRFYYHQEYGDNWAWRHLPPVRKPCRILWLSLRSKNVRSVSLIYSLVISWTLGYNTTHYL